MYVFLTLNGQILSEAILPPVTFLNLLYYLSVVLHGFLLPDDRLVLVYSVSDSKSPSLTTHPRSVGLFHQCPDLTRYRQFLELGFVLFSYYL